VSFDFNQTIFITELPFSFVLNLTLKEGRQPWNLPYTKQTCLCRRLFGRKGLNGHVILIFETTHKGFYGKKIIVITKYVRHMFSKY